MTAGRLRNIKKDIKVLKCLAWAEAVQGLYAVVVLDKADASKGADNTLESEIIYAS